AAGALPGHASAARRVRRDRTRHRSPRLATLAVVMTGAPRQPIVVCVDDDEAMLNTVVRCLKREPIEIRSTLSASEALGWIAAEGGAVLVSDYEMPEMTGAQ